MGQFETVLFPKEANAPLPPALETNLGLGIANRREDDPYLETISKLIQKLKSLYPTQVIFCLITKENTNNGIVQVWGANEYNATNPLLGGKGQAKVAENICKEIGPEKTKDLLIGIITAGI